MDLYEALNELDGNVASGSKPTDKYIIDDYKALPNGGEDEELVEDRYAECSVAWAEYLKDALKERGGINFSDSGNSSWDGNPEYDEVWDVEAEVKVEADESTGRAILSVSPITSGYADFELEIDPFDYDYGRWYVDEDNKVKFAITAEDNKGFIDRILQHVEEDANEALWDNRYDDGPDEPDYEPDDDSWLDYVYDPIG